MAAKVDVEKEFVRLFMFSHKISLPVVRTYFVSSVLGEPNYNNDIVTFLEHHKHELFHLVGDYKCCQCTKLPSLQAKLHTFRLANDQFKKLYDVGLSTSGHFTKGSGGRIFQQCLCCITTKKDTNPKTYDISLLIALIYNCVQLSDNNRLWLETIRKCRNKLCHIHDINDLSKSELHTLWGNLECSLLNLAGEVTAQPAYKESIELLVDTFKYADYSRDTITPLLEAMKAEINNNVNGVIQHQSEKMVDHMNILSKQSEEQRNLDKKESQSQLLAVTTEISAKVEACHSEEKRVIEHQTIELKGALEERQQKEESLLCAIHKDVEIIKGNVMSHKRDQISFDIQLANTTNPTKSQECPIKHTEDTENVDWKGLMLYSMEIKDSFSIHPSDRQPTYHFPYEEFPFWRNLDHEDHEDILLIGCCRDIEWIESVLTVCKKLTQICQIEQKQKSKTVLNRENIKAVIYVASRLSQQSCDLKSMLECLTQSKYLPDKVFTVVMDTVMTLDMFPESKQLHVSSKQKEWLPDLIDGFSKTGLILFSLHSDDERRSILLLGNYKNVVMISSLLYQYRQMPCLQHFEILLRKKSSRFPKNHEFKGIVCIASPDFKVESHPDIIHLKHLSMEVVTLVTNKMTLPAELKGTKQIDATGNYVDWLPEFIGAIQKMLSTVWILKCINPHHFRRYQAILLMGNMRDVQWFNSAFLKSGLFQHTTLMQTHLQKLHFTSIKCVICIIAKKSEEDLSLHQSITIFNCWPNGVVTVVREKMKIPDPLMETRKIYVTDDDDAEWLTDLLNIFRRTGMTDFLGPDESLHVNEQLPFRINPYEKDKLEGDTRFKISTKRKELEPVKRKGKLFPENEGKYKIKRPSWKTQTTMKLLAKGADEEIEKGSSSTKYEFASFHSDTFGQHQGVDDKVYKRYSPNKYDSSTLDSGALRQLRDHDPVDNKESKTSKRKHDEMDI